MSIRYPYNVIYAITWLTSDRIYIGSAVDFVKRRCQHLDALRHHRHFNIRLQRLFNREGEANIRFEVLEYVDSPDALLQHEQARLDALFDFSPEKAINFRRVAGSQLGLRRKLTPEQIARATAAHTGLFRSAESRACMSAAQKGKTFSPEHKAKLAVAARLRWQREEERQRLVDAAIARTGRRTRNDVGQFV